jgi:hypothetical protein
MQDENEISAIPLAEATPPAGHAWAVRRRAGDVTTYLVACNLKRPLWVGPQASAKQYGDLRIAGIAASWLVQHGNVPPSEISVVAVPLVETSPVRERMIARTVRRARQLSVEADSELDVYDARNRIMKNAVAQVERDKQHKQAGFAMLLEVLVLCAIMLALCAALAPNMVKAGRALNFKAARQRAQAVWQIEQASTVCHATQGADCTAVDYLLPPAGAAPGPGGYTFTYTPGTAWLYVGQPSDTTLPQVAIAANGVLYCGTAQCSATY